MKGASTRSQTRQKRGDGAGGALFRENFFPKLFQNDLQSEKKFQVAIMSDSDNFSKRCSDVIYTKRAQIF